MSGVEDEDKDRGEAEGSGAGDGEGAAGKGTSESESGSRVRDMLDALGPLLDPEPPTDPEITKQVERTRLRVMSDEMLDWLLQEARLERDRRQVDTWHDDYHGDQGARWGVSSVACNSWSLPSASAMASAPAADVRTAKGRWRGISSVVMKWLRQRNV